MFCFLGAKIEIIPNIPKFLSHINAEPTVERYFILL